MTTELISKGFVEVAFELALDGGVEIHHQVEQKREFQVKVHSLSRAWDSSENECWY